MKKRIALISFGTGGTMGHMSLITKLASKLSEHGFKCKILSEYEYQNFSNINNSGVDYIKIPAQEHMKTVAGCLGYKHKDKVIDIIKKEKFQVLVFSTFFDTGILKYAKENNIKTILISYPLRDSHRKAFEIRGYFKLFDKIFTLKDITNTERLFYNEEIVSPFFICKNQKKDFKVKKIKNILITCGGGGRPSAELFFGDIQKFIPLIVKKNPAINFTIIRGNYDGKFIELPNSNIIGWSNNFLELLTNYDLVISEAGYFTTLELLLVKKPAILIPGERRIDNQELRALNFQDKGCGICIFPIENINFFVNELNKILENPSILTEFSENLEKEYNDVYSYHKLDEKIIEEIK
jgi:UDP-N-acetylglucosamine:LPS N-acetylglucosamine transferase